MIEVENLVKKYKDNIVLDSISVNIYDGEMFSVMGPSGCGKSTFIKCLVRLIKPDGGRIIADGKNMAAIDDEFELAKYRRNFSYLFQGGALFDSLNVMENVCFGLKYLTDAEPSNYERIAKEKLSLVGLNNVEELEISELSGGMKKRVSLARAIATEPKYILYDEPTTGIDPVTSETISDLILDMQKKLDITSIVVTHDLKLAFSISDRVAMLHAGKFDFVGTPDDFRKSDNSVVKGFINNSIIDENNHKNGRE